MFQMVSNRHAAANLKGSLYFKKADIGLQSTLPHRSGAFHNLLNFERPFAKHI
jgi:hypothetical protein